MATLVFKTSDISVCQQLRTVEYKGWTVTESDLVVIWPQHHHAPNNVESGITHRTFTLPICTRKGRYEIMAKETFAGKGDNRQSIVCCHVDGRPMLPLYVEQDDTRNRKERRKKQYKGGDVVFSVKHPLIEIRANRFGDVHISELSIRGGKRKKTHATLQHEIMWEGRGLCLPERFSCYKKPVTHALAKIHGKVAIGFFEK